MNMRAVGEHFVGGGIAAFDRDGDVLLDLFAAGGTNSAILLRNKSDATGLVFVEGSPTPLIEIRRKQRVVGCQYL